jgi:hypothetical protein
MKTMTKRDMLRYRASHQALLVRECKKAIAREEAKMIAAKYKFRDLQREISAFDKET